MEKEVFGSSMCVCGGGGNRRREPNLKLHSDGKNKQNGKNRRAAEPTEPLSVLHASVYVGVWRSVCRGVEECM